MIIAPILKKQSYPDIHLQLCRSEDVLDAIEQVQDCLTSLINFASIGSHQMRTPATSIKMVA